MEAKSTELVGHQQEITKKLSMLANMLNSSQSKILPYKFGDGVSLALANMRTVETELTTMGQQIQEIVNLCGDVLTLYDHIGNAYLVMV